MIKRLYGIKLPLVMNLLDVIEVQKTQKNGAV